ncbi:unnamed protein product [Natator depressus]|uniref:ecto-ADP-ribosyltransferase 5-like n=1 Tax=Natator depressus TaxID=27790 RepID=UPI003D5049F0
MLRPLLIPWTYFCLQTLLGTPQAKCQKELNMTNDAFDDQYLGCPEKMEAEARELLKTEMSTPYSAVWQTATKKWKDVKKTSPLKASEDEYGIAVVAYTDPTPIINGDAFSTIFNAAVSGAGKSQDNYMKEFRFKAFHYYLTRALQLLREAGEGGCVKVYPGDIHHFQLSNKEDDKIRFGHFASSSINEEVAEGFRTETTGEKGTLFTIHTCFGVKIQDMSYNPGQKEVLIPVHETFTVSQKGNNLFDLQSTERTCSHFNCAYLGGEKTKKCVYNSAARGGLAFPSVLSPSLFGGSVILLHVAALKLFAGF